MDTVTSALNLLLAGNTASAWALAPSGGPFQPALSAAPSTFAMPVAALSWSAPAAITYGTALSVTQLNASSNVAGSYSYSPVAGTLLGAGTQTLRVTFNPTDTADYPSIQANVSLVVNQAQPVVTVAPANNPTAYASPFTINASLSPASSGAAAPTGTVTFTIAGGRRWQRKSDCGRSLCCCACGGECLSAGNRICDLGFLPGRYELRCGNGDDHGLFFEERSGRGERPEQQQPKPGHH